MTRLRSARDIVNSVAVRNVMRLRRCAASASEDGRNRLWSGGDWRNMPSVRSNTAPGENVAQSGSMPRKCCSRKRKAMWTLEALTAGVEAKVSTV